ncbi:MAG: indole-3-glycerol phosphate synthase TrpC [Planctomycetaceae bacterium]|jgi:indole-3-glycerol phosphate synthase|nr:indole-3-glycerol phosphate synthase TrpC [Planctomycetaceae bacterium]
MSDILSEIVRRRRLDYASASGLISISELIVRNSERVEFRSFRDSLLLRSVGVGEVAIIAEVKRGSPSNGLFASGLDPVSCAIDYESGGAAALSVLTEGNYFGGNLNDLIVARANCGLPVLRKDFIVTEYQVYETSAYADCMLLIARLLDGQMLKSLYDLAAGLKLEVLVEVYDESDIEKISAYNFPLIGINNRNLSTMNIDINNSIKLAACFDAGQMLVAASGIHSRNDIERVMSCGIKSFLIGESLSRNKNRIQFLRNLATGK